MARILPFVVGQYLMGWCIGKNADTSDAKSGKTTEKEKYLWIQRVTNALFVCISLLMSKAATPTNTLLLHIKVFLTCCYRFGVSIGNQFMANKGNYFCLLNLPDQIKRFGSIRLYWDGNKEHSSEYHLGWEPPHFYLCPNFRPISILEITKQYSI